MEKLDEIFISTVRSILRERKIKRKDLAEKIEITPQHFSKVMNGKKPLPKTLERAIARELGIDLGAPAAQSAPVTLAPETVKSLASELNKFILPPMTSDEAKTLELLKEDARAAKLFSLFLKLSERGRDLLIRKAEDLLEIHPAPPRDR